MWPFGMGKLLVSVCSMKVDCFFGSLLFPHSHWSSFLYFFSGDEGNRFLQNAALHLPTSLHTVVTHTNSNVHRHIAAAVQNNKIE